MKLPLDWDTKSSKRTFLALKGIQCAVFGIFLAATAQAQGAPKVVASIKPVHSLVSAVMEGIGEPGLIVEGAGSPHGYSLKPSDAAELENADLVVWAGPDLEVFLEGPIRALSRNAEVVALSEAHGVKLLPYREDGDFEAHAHEDGEHEHENGHDSGEDRSDHNGAGMDMHFWLDPQNARALVHEIEVALSAIDADNAGVYAGNARKLEDRIDALDAEIRGILAPVAATPYVVFHDGYQYFEKHYGLNAVGSISVSPEARPGAARVAGMREKVKELGAVCVFSEPQFDPRLVAVIAEGSNARPGVLDPLGADLEDGPDQYFDLLRNLAKSLAECLSGEG
ncbi:zinc ABC transporter substrate-binding protein [Rhizobiales bacterium]|uniref:zinc ABC transporter substrate-binding protein n=1 Tax=Hongsoonwoonella zoysiae TaxID=2821844 RepID=UPI00156177F3|nr:zinc ABC transporter substrate-binding protein [Hongsoonwoonella zoysiae]NRG17477.1 zinc ABC transporter substrate-binding protein [Hongsoonwoonella zoysiae]